MKGDTIEVVTTAGNMFRVTEDNQAECRACGAPIVWCITARGKKMPVDRAQGTPATSHFATCPDAATRRT